MAEDKSLGLGIAVFIILFLVLIIAFAVIQAYIIWDKVNFDFDKAFREIDINKINADVSGLGIDLTQINLQNFNLSDIVTGQGTLKLQLAIDIINDNAFPIYFKDLKATFYYNNTLIGDTSDDLLKKQFVVCGTKKVTDTSHSCYNEDNVLTVTDQATLYLNKAGIQLLQKKWNKEEVKFKWTVKLKIGIVIGKTIRWVQTSYTDNIVW